MENYRRIIAVCREKEWTACPKNQAVVGSFGVAMGRLTLYTTWNLYGSAAISHKWKESIRLFLHYYGEFEVAEENTTIEITKTDDGYRISDIDYHPVSLQ